MNPWSIPVASLLLVQALSSDAQIVPWGATSRNKEPEKRAQMPIEPVPPSDPKPNPPQIDPDCKPGTRCTTVPDKKAPGKTADPKHDLHMSPRAVKAE